MGRTSRVAIALTVLAALALMCPPVDGDLGGDRGPPMYEPLVMSTFLGGSGVDWAHAVEVDPMDGSIFVAGYTDSSDFPTTDGAYQRSLAGAEDVYVAKLSPDGTSIQWSTYIGGSFDEMAWDIEVIMDGSVIVAGHTESVDFPTTPGAYSRQLDGDEDAFVCRLDENGTMVYSTLLGGEGADKAFSIEAVGSTVFVAGETESTFFPTTSGAHDRSLDGFSDIFLTLLESDGGSIKRSTLLGGGYTEAEPDIELGYSNDIWITGSTTSTDFPTTAGAYDRTPRGGRDVFLTSMDRALTEVQRSTLLGGDGNDVPRSVDALYRGGVMVAGFTQSVGFPVTGDAFSSEHGGLTDGFISIFEPDVRDVEYSTFVGGASFDAVRRAMFNPHGTLIATGYTNSTNFPTTPDAYTGSKAQDDHDTFFLELDYGSGRGNYSTLLGSTMGDFGMDMYLTRGYAPIMVGHTRSSDFPTTPGVVQPGYRGAGDAFVVRFAWDVDPPELDDATPDQAETGGNLIFKVHTWDASYVDFVQVEYWFDDGGPTLLNMTYEWPRPDYCTGTFYLEVTISESAQNLSYRYIAADYIGRLNFTDVRTIPVLDTLLPYLVGDLTPANGTTGDPLGFRAALGDNVGVAHAFVEYAMGGIDGNASMSPVSGSVGTFNHSVTLPGDSLDPVRYRLVFSDHAGNWNATPWSQVAVVDDDPPVLGGPQVQYITIPGTPIVVEAEASDNIGVTRAYMTYQMGSGPTQSVEAVLPLDEVLRFIVPTLEDDRWYVVLNVYVEDAQGNTASDIGATDIRDPHPPRIVGIDHAPEATTGDPLTVRWDAEDEMDIAFMWLLYWYGEGSDQNPTLLDSLDVPNGTVTIPVPGDSALPLYFTLFARDESGNTNETRPIVVPVVDDDPPVADAGADYRLHVGQRISFDGGNSTDNIGIVDYVWRTYAGEELVHEANSSMATLFVFGALDGPGEYRVVLVVRDAAGNGDTDTMVLTMLPAEEEVGEGRDYTPYLVIIAIIIVVVILTLIMVYRQE